MNVGDGGAGAGEGVRAGPGCGRVVAVGAAGSGLGAGAGAGAGKQDRKGRKRKYVAFTFDEGDEDGLPRGYVNPLSQMYGNDRSITPAKRVDDGWDPRQW